MQLEPLQTLHSLLFPIAEEPLGLVLPKETTGTDIVFLNWLLFLESVLKYMSFSVTSLLLCSRNAKNKTLTTSSSDLTVCKIV
jgi:hypothetical protein